VGEERIRYRLRQRRGFGRAAVVFALLAALVAFAGCGGGDEATASGEKADDAKVLNGALERELTAVEAYDRGLDQMHGQALVLARVLRGQDQQHLDALTKAMRGLGAPVEAEAAELESAGSSQADALELAYEQESAALGYYLDAVRHLQTMAPRRLAAAIGASHAQHLVVLRQALGAPLTAAAPEATESGDVPPPPQRPPKKG